jgi:antitoxin CcdA
MKPPHLYNTQAAKKSVNLTANADLLHLAKAAGINLSQALEEAVAEKLRLHLEKQWREENKEAIAAYNARVEKNGVFAASKRRF